MTLTNEDIAGSLLPNIYVSRIILQSTPEDKLLANVQLAIKETYGNDEISSWLEDAEILRYLRIFVIQSANEKATNLIKDLFDGKYSIEALPQRNYFANPGSFELLKNYLRAFGVIRAPEELELKTVPLFNFSSEFVKNSILELERMGIAEKINNSDGSQSYNIYCDINFDNNLTENPKHLSYLFGSIYDLSELMQELGQTAEETIDVARLDVEVAISDGQISEKTFIYLDQDNRIWTGPIHVAEKNGITYFRSGQTESSESIDLVEVEIENNKIQDFRQLSRNLDFLESLNGSTFDSQTLDSFEKINIEQQMRNQKDNSCISNGYTSIDSEGNTSVSFFIDLKKMFIKNSPYGQVLFSLNTSKSKSLINSLYKLATIESIALYSKRIDIDDSLFPNKQTEKIVAHYNGTEQIRNLSKPVLLPEIEQNTAEQLHLFSIADMLTSKAGIYEYYVEIDYKDGTDEELKKIINTLKEEQRSFIEYYNIAISPKVFNTTTNRFRAESFRNLVIDFNVRELYFLTVLEKFFDVERQLIEQLILNITNFLSPIQGTPESIRYVIDLYDQIINKIQKVFSLVPFVNNSLNEKNEGMASQEKIQSVSKIIKIRKNLRAIVDKEYDYLYEYLNHIRLDTTGLYNSTGLLYETLKTDLVFKKLDSSKRLIRVNGQNQQNELLFEKLNNIFSDFADLKIDAFVETNINSSTTRQTQTAIQKFEPSFLARSQYEDFTRELNLDDKKTLNTLMLALFSSTVDKSNKNLEFILDSGNSDNIMWDIQPDGASISHVLTTSVVVGLFKNRRLTISQIKNLPNQIKSLIKLKTENLSSVINDSEVRFKYEMLKEIKYITKFDFNSQDEVFNLQSPKWITLKDLTLLQNNSQKTIFCKIVDYNNQKINYRFNQALKEACTNEYFFINNVNINDNGFITENNGATQISLDMFEQRCVKELEIFFDGNSEPQINFPINGNLSLLNDSYTNSKYSFLSPYGIFIDNNFRVINLKNNGSVLDTINMRDGIINAGRISGRPLPSLTINPSVIASAVAAANIRPVNTTNGSPRTAIAIGARNIASSVQDGIANTIKQVNPINLSIYTRNNRLRMR